MKAAQHPIKSIPNPQNGYQNNRYDLVNGYTYIPIAYIPGANGITYNSPTNYNPGYYSQNSVSHGNRYTTVQPIYATSAAPNPPKNAHPQHYDEFQDEVPTGGLLQFLVTSVASDEPAANHPQHKKVTSYRVPNAQPILYGKSPNDYLSFRYSDVYKGQTPDYDATTTPLTVEITSPKQYIVPALGGTSTTPSHLTRVTSSPAPAIDAYRSPTQFVQPASLSSHNTLSIKPVPSGTAEQATQSSKVLVTYTEGQELEHQSSLNSHYQLPYAQRPYVNSVATTDFTIDDIFKGYNINKQLPERITADNIKESIQTLTYLLQILQKADSITHFEKKPHVYATQVLDGLKETTPLLLPEEPKSVNTYQNYDPLYETYDIKEHISPQLPTKNDHNTPGRAGIDYPTYSVIPETRFSCKTQRYKGFFADPETKCQVSFDAQKRTRKWYR